MTCVTLFVIFLRRKEISKERKGEQKGARKMENFCMILQLFNDFLNCKACITYVSLSLSGLHKGKEQRERERERERRNGIAK